jgi:hypothetical protein
LSLLLLTLPISLSAQMPASIQREEMKKLDYMVGQWKGTGWIERGAGRQSFAGTETVQSKLGGIALLVEGNFKGKLPNSEQESTVHETLGVISYDEKAKLYRFRTYLAAGNTGDHELSLIEGGWQWGMQTPRGNVRYIFKLSEKGEWLEIGEFSQDGNIWQKFFEMTLRRVL